MNPTPKRWGFLFDIYFKIVYYCSKIKSPK